MFNAPFFSVVIFEVLAGKIREAKNVMVAVGFQ